MKAYQRPLDSTRPFRHATKRRIPSPSTPAPDPRHASSENHFPSSENHFSDPENHFPNSGNHFPDSESHFPSSENHFSDSESHFPNSENHFPSSGNHFPSRERAIPSRERANPSRGCHGPSPVGRDVVMRCHETIYRGVAMLMRLSHAPQFAVPEARKILAGGATTGPRPRNTNRALEGREKGTRGLAATIAGEHSHASRAPAGAHPESGMVGLSGSGGFTTG